MNRALGVTLHIALLVHLLGKAAAGANIGKEHVAIPREQLFFKAVALAGFARDMELVSDETIHSVLEPGRENWDCRAQDYAARHLQRASHRTIIVNGGQRWLTIEKSATLLNPALPNPTSMPVRRTKPAIQNSKFPILSRSSATSSRPSESLVRRSRNPRRAIKLPRRRVLAKAE